MRSLLVAAVVLVSALARAAEPMVPYDNFNPGEPSPPTTARVHGLDWRRWAARDVGTGTDEVRKQAGMRLRLQHTSADAAGSLGMAFIDPAKVTAIESAVRVVRGAATGCGATAGAVEAQVGGAFFNVGTPSPRSAVGDVRAWLKVSRSSADAPHADLAVTAVVERCDDAGCTVKTPLWSASLGKVREEQRAVLRVTWEGDVDRFAFVRDGAAPVEWSYRLTDAAAPGLAFKSLETAQRLPVCASAKASMNAYFHDVLVNRSAAPPAL